MGQVKIWLNSQPDISEIPKIPLLVMIIIAVFLCGPLWLLRSPILLDFWLIFCIYFLFNIVNVVVKKGVTATLWHSEACDEFGLAK